jgi:group I intron endonuclease
MKKTGIYKIKNTKNGDFYIGSASDMRGRIKYHKKVLRDGTHHNKYLLRAWRKYGEEVFVFSPVLYCAKQDLLLYEQLCITGLAPQYNLMRVAESGGWSHAEQSRQRISDAVTRMHADPSPAVLAHKANQRAEKERNRQSRLARAAAMLEASKRRITYQGETKALGEWSELLGVTKSTLRERITQYAGDLDKAFNVGVKAATYSVDGISLTLREWAERLGEKYVTLYMRLHKGRMSPEVALVPRDEFIKGKANRPRKESSMAKKYTHAGETLTLKQWGEKLGVTAASLYSRIHSQGWPLDEALTTASVQGRRPDTYEFRGEQRSAAEIAAALGVSRTNVTKRLAAGETPDQIEAAVAAKRFTLDGVTDTATGWGRRLGCSGAIVANRLSRAENYEECLRKLRDEGVQPARRPRGKHIDADVLEMLLM